jgi:hypothetical protein
MSRKAGSENFKNELSRAERNRQYRESLLTNSEERAKRLEGIEGIEGLDEKLVSQALQGSTFGEEDRARYDALLGKQDGGKDSDTDPDNTTPTNQGGGGQTIGDVSGGTDSIVSPISQDNDIAIDGNQNTVNQDNSINQTVDNSDNSTRYYGGSSRTFNYRGGDGESNLYDSPVSKATMGGYYDTDDSPAAAAKFMDMYVDSNILGQRDIRKDYDKRKITDYGANDPGRMSQLESRLDKSILGSRSRADKQERKLFGDNPFRGTFNLPQLPNPVVDNTMDIYEDSIIIWRTVPLMVNFSKSS